MKTLMTVLSIAVASLSLTVLATDANARYKKPLAKPKLSCYESGSGETMSDGSSFSWNNAGSKGTTSCSDGTVCTDWKVLQGDGSWKSFHECKYAPVKPSTRTNAIGQPEPTIGARR
jgi:hypothetical protein